MKKIVLFVTVLIFSLVLLSAQSIPPLPQPPKDDFKTYHGKRIPNQPSDFRMTGLRILEVDDDLFYIDLFFSSEINPLSIQPDSFLILIKFDNTKLDFPPPPLNTEPIPYRFMKDSKGIRLEVPKKYLQKPFYTYYENFELVVQKIRSWENKEMQSEHFEDLTLNSQYHYSQREKEWKKF